MTYLAKGIIFVLTVMLFAQAWLTVQALDEERKGSVFDLYSKKNSGHTRNTMIYSTIILIIGTGIFSVGVFKGGKSMYKSRSTFVV